MSKKVDQLIDEILNQQHTEEDEYFVDSGAGESLDMICSGYIYFKEQQAKVD